MPRYFFHLVSNEHVVRDDQGVYLNELSAAHWYAMKLQHQIWVYSQGSVCEWMVKVSDDSGATPLIVLPRADRSFSGSLPRPLKEQFVL